MKEKKEEVIEMLVTSKEANKILNKLESDHNDLIKKEEEVRTFLSSVGEDLESCRPEYDYESVQKELETIENKIIKLKHQINMFNISTKVDGFDKTIDEMLVYIPQLSRRHRKLGIMSSTRAKFREAINMRSTIIDYRYVNYDVNKALEDYNAVDAELTRAQIALDTANLNNKFEIEL